jgi:hypothetical protein
VRDRLSPTSLEPGSLPQRIRKAVGSGEFAKARLLWEEYGCRFHDDLLRGPVPHSRLTEARELADWTRMVALCARAHAQARLNQMAAAKKYGEPERPPETTRIARF